MRGQRRALSTALLTATLVLSAACSGSTSEKVVVGATAEAMRKSAQATLDKGTSRVEMDVTTTIQGRDVHLTATGVQDPANKRFQLDFDARDLLSQVAGDRSLPPGAGTALEQPLTMLLDGTVTYMHFPALAKLGGGKEWLKIDLAQVNQSAGDLLGAGGGSGAFGSDPTSFLRFLEGAGKVTEVGTEQVRDVTTRHFSGSYTIRDSLAALPDDQRERVEKAFTSLGLPASAEDQEIPFDVWIDEDGLVRRIAMTIDPSKLAPAGGAAPPVGPFTTTTEFFDFGTKVDLAIPSEDEVRDLTSLVGQGQSDSTNSVN